ncbi:MAG TPA: response regulator [Longimicrobiales bacterium]
MAKILIVEDNLDLLAILRELLSVEHEVETARRGEEAVLRAKEFEPDLVILDLQLPSMDGIEAGRWIKKELEPRRVAILALTALAQAGDPEAILASGCCDAYMAKPASLEDIRSAVESLLRVGERT